MSKKQKAPQKVKKSIKPAKTKPATKNAKASKPASKTAVKKKSTPVKASKKPVKKTITKKSVKSVKPVKKAVSKPAKKAIKPVKAGKVIAKKAAAKPVKAAKSIKKVAKPVKAANSAKKAAKEVKPLKKTGKVELIIIKNKAGKSEKPKKVEKPVKEAKKKAEKPVIDTKKPLSPKSGKSKGGRKPKNKGDDDEPEIVHDELIEQLIQSTKKKKSGPKVPKILKTFVNPITSLSLASDELDKKGAPKKEPKGKFELEYVIRTSAGILYEFITSPSGLSEWFADDVNIRDGIFTFFWDGSEQKAKLLGFKEERFIRLRWIDRPEGTFFEFRIEKDELTGDISLIIVDFADEASDMQTSKLLWDSQVNKLLGVLGSN